MHVTTIAVAIVTETRPAACLVVGGIFFSCYNIMVSILLIPFVSNNAIVILVGLVRGSNLLVQLWHRNIIKVSQASQNS